GPARASLEPHPLVPAHPDRLRAGARRAGLHPRDGPLPRGALARHPRGRLLHRLRPAAPARHRPPRHGMAPRLDSARRLREAARHGGAGGDGRRHARLLAPRPDLPPETRRRPRHSGRGRARGQLPAGGAALRRPRHGGGPSHGQHRGRRRGGGLGRGTRRLARRRRDPRARRRARGALRAGAAPRAAARRAAHRAAHRARGRGAHAHRHARRARGRAAGRHGRARHPGRRHAAGAPRPLGRAGRRRVADRRRHLAIAHEHRRDAVRAAQRPRPRRADPHRGNLRRGRVARPRGAGEPDGAAVRQPRPAEPVPHPGARRRPPRLLCAGSDPRTAAAAQSAGVRLPRRLRAAGDLVRAGVVERHRPRLHRQARRAPRGL
ncbi:MAG: Intramembrane protease RasP/YluC, implicated in cell division based on FtsL cleavage, partial [uncultured Acetobacteraceae bacterium]